MAYFTKKTWKDRLVEFAGRRTLKNVGTNESVTYDVTRAEGTVSQEGDAFSPANMNDMEQRIADGFSAAEAANNQLSSELGNIGKLLWSGSFTSGSITVPGLSNYLYIIVNVGGVPCFGSPEYGGITLGGYSSYDFAYRSYRFSVNGDKVTIDDINRGGSDGTGNVEVRNIIGLVSKISA